MRDEVGLAATAGRVAGRLAGAGSSGVLASQLAMMDVADHRALFSAVRRVLVPRGVFVFSTLRACLKARPFHVRDAPKSRRRVGGFERHDRKARAVKLANSRRGGISRLWEPSGAR